MRRYLFPTALIFFAVFVVIREYRQTRRIQVNDAGPVSVAVAEAATSKMTMAEVIDLAKASLASMTENVNDYTTRFVKQEPDSYGNMTPEAEMILKVMPRHRDGKTDAPVRVYLDFLRPESEKGREVIWCEDKYDGQLVAHEGGLLGLLTVRLDPTGFLAMRGQRYPITNIGLTRLVEMLIERGTADVGNPNVNVTLTKNHPFDGQMAELIQVRRTEPSGGPEDYSIAEIVFDRERMLILQYRSYGWSDDPNQPVGPLLESYSYYDLKTNVGLTEADFDPDNPNYRYP